MVDQVLSSGTQFLLTILIAHVATAEIFGAASVVLIVQGLVLGIQRAFVGDVFLMRCRRIGIDPLREVSSAMVVSAGLGLVIAAVIALAGLAIGGQVGPLLLLLAAITPVTFLHDLLRSLAFGRRRVVDALVVDGAWMFGFVAVASYLIVTDQATASSLILAWGGGALLGFLVGVGSIMPLYRPSSVRALVRDERTRSLTFLADYSVNSGVSLVSFLILGFFMPLAEYGALRLARTAMTPPGNVMAGVRSLMLGRIAETRSDPRSARRLRARVAPSFAAFASVYGAVVLLMPVSAGERLFGGNWAVARPLVLAVALGEVARFAAQPSIDIVRVLGTPSELLRTRLVSSGGSVLAVLGGGYFWGSEGVVWGGAIVMTTIGILWWVRSTAVTGADRQPPADITAGS